MFIILSDCSEVYVNDNLPYSLYSVPITSITWREIIKSINQVYSNANNKEKYLLRELKEYLPKVVLMENKESNWVYVVSLANNTPSWSKISWKDVVYKKKRYFYPAHGGWPKIRPNYIVFRFDGKLLSIHHVEDYEVVDDMHKEIILKDTIICPKCKKDISNEKCITSSGMFISSLMALTMGMIGEKEGSFKIPLHLRGMAIVTKENFEVLKVHSKASIKLADKL